MNYKIVKKEGFKIVGVKEDFEMNMEEMIKQIPKFWQKTASSGMLSKIAKSIGIEPFGMLGVSVVSDSEKYNYYIAVATDDSTPEGLEEYIIPARTWAVFESTGKMAESIQNLQERILSEWLPESGYELIEDLNIEVSLDKDNTENSRYQVWVSIVKKD